MAVLDVLKANGANRVDRIDGGLGTVRERTLEVGNTVIVLDNIGAMTMIDPKRDHGLTIVGGVIAIVGLAWRTTGGAVGIVILLVGLAMVATSLLRPVTLYLSIGTCDGHRLDIASTNRQFLLDLRGFLCAKFDRDDDRTATINITAGSISGGMAIGRGASATGSGGDMPGRGAHG